MVKDVQEAVDIGGRGDFLAEFAGQGGFQVLAVFDAAAGQDPVRVLAGADPLDGQQVTVGGDQQAADTIGHGAP